MDSPRRRWSRISREQWDRLFEQEPAPQFVTTTGTSRARDAQSPPRPAVSPPQPRSPPRPRPITSPAADQLLRARAKRTVAAAASSRAADSSARASREALYRHNLPDGRQYETLLPTSGWPSSSPRGGAAPPHRLTRAQRDALGVSSMLAAHTGDFEWHGVAVSARGERSCEARHVYGA